jgi:membrane-associated protease RseP (regulator of RpoE activity)
MILLLISILICVGIHELAHLVAAKLVGCGVEVYSIGFGKPYYQITFKETRYRISPWLLGGYCKLKGELEYTRKKGAFIRLPYTKKLIVSLAGIAVNVLMGLLSTALGKYYNNYQLIYFGYISFWLGITNLLPVVPCLDGGYCLFYPILTKKFGYKKGTEIFANWVKQSFKIIMWINAVSLFFLFMFIGYQLITTGGINVSF